MLKPFPVLGKQGEEPFPALSISERNPWNHRVVKVGKVLQDRPAQLFTLH